MASPASVGLAGVVAIATIDRVSHGGKRCVGGHGEGVVCASLCARWCPLVETSQKSVMT